MIKDIKMDIVINGRNRAKYEMILNKTLSNGEIIQINQIELLNASRLEVVCECDYCGHEFKKQRVSLGKGKTFCGNKCRNENLKNVFKSDKNPNPKKDKIDVKCVICDKQIKVFESKFKKQESFLCSRECYKKHRSDKYKGENIYNYQEVFTNCATCGKKVKTSKWYLDNKANIFCGNECYWVHRKDFYKEFYYKDDLNEHRKETMPEKKVREWLLDNNIRFIQEAGFLKKYYVDFYLPDHKAIIEVYGDYWHVNPDVYDISNNDSSKKRLHQNQRDFVDSKRDEIRVRELESYGYKVYVIWEKEIKNILNDKLKSFFN
ncbi:MAG: hypothetical protein ACRC4N_02445 [Gammaproteobacteria bacterium]